MDIIKYIIKKNIIFLFIIYMEKMEEIIINIIKKMEELMKLFIILKNAYNISRKKLKNSNIVSFE